MYRWRLHKLTWSPTGNKKDNVTVIYTPWSNLKKDGSMAVGQVGFKDQKKVESRFSLGRTLTIADQISRSKRSMSKLERIPL